MSGNGSLVDVGDLRPIRLPANADPATNPDKRSGAIVVRDCTFGPGIAKAISISGYRGGASPKKVTVEASGCSFTEPKPNGHRLNLGRYGGTAEASLTLTGGTILLVQ